MLLLHAIFVLYYGDIHFGYGNIKILDFLFFCTIVASKKFSSHYQIFNYIRVKYKSLAWKFCESGP